MSAYLGFLGAAVVISGITATVAVFAIRNLRNHPVRIAAVLVGLSGLFGSLAPLVSELHGGEPPRGVMAPLSVPSATVATECSAAAVADRSPSPAPAEPSAAPATGACATAGASPLATAAAGGA